MLARSFLSLALILGLASAAQAQTASSKPGLQGIGFLVGTWAGSGKVADTGGTTRGTSTIATAVGGAVLLRRDHTDLFDAAGKPAGDFDQIMMIYPEGGTLHADYSDGDHVIHYTSAVIVPGRSVAFTSAASPTTPTFRLTYELTAPKTLGIRFEMEPPGQTEFHTIATGTAEKQ